MTTPDNWRPAGASDDPRWATIATLVLAITSRAGFSSNANARCEQEAVRAVNEMLEGADDAQMLEYARRLNDIAVDVELAQGGLGGAANASDLRRIAQRIVAQPKPAPDAMREALEAAREYIGRDNNPKSNRVLNLILAALCGIDLATMPAVKDSAPVPSPDGARREVETTLQMIRNAAADATLRDPSATGAAEPDAVPRMARFLANMTYHRGVAFGKGVETADTWVDANWQEFQEDARRLLISISTSNHGHLR